MGDCSMVIITYLLLGALLGLIYAVMTGSSLWFIALGVVLLPFAASFVGIIGEVWNWIWKRKR